MEFAIFLFSLEKFQLFTCINEILCVKYNFLAMESLKSGIVTETGRRYRKKFVPVKTPKIIKKKSKENKEIRKIVVPSHRYTPLRENWVKIVGPIVEHLKLQIRFNTKSRCVELRPDSDEKDDANLQKGADFVRAFILGFDVEDALALLRLESLFIESFEIKDVKTLKNQHLSRAIGRLAGKGGRTKFTIENVTKTRIVLADSKIHILG